VLGGEAALRAGTRALRRGLRRSGRVALRGFRYGIRGAFCALRVAAHGGFRALRVAVNGGFRALRAAPPPVTIAVAAMAGLAVALAANWTYQVARKPSELFFPVSGRLYKSPAETWEAYAPLFRRHSTGVMTPDLLAALAQVEASGNPIARTYWRFAPTLAPFEIYRPASSSVGLYQMTNGTFAEARRYCIHGHAVAEQGAWNDLRACWFNALYTRTLPSHAIELASAYLDRRVADVLAKTGASSATLSEQQALAAAIHLCGAGAATAYAKGGFRARPGQRCGAHDLAAYLARVRAMQARFRRLAAAG
jgi:hypothetical protein